jgi:hypothetical protein
LLGFIQSRREARRRRGRGHPRTCRHHQRQLLGHKLDKVLTRRSEETEGKYRL